VEGSNKGKEEKNGEGRGEYGASSVPPHFSKRSAAAGSGEKPEVSEWGLR